MVGKLSAEDEFHLAEDYRLHGHAVMFKAYVYGGQFKSRLLVAYSKQNQNKPLYLSMT